MRHTLFNRAFHTNETNAVLVLDQFAHWTNTTVTEVIDIVDRTAAVVQFAEVEQGRKNVFFGEDRSFSTRDLVFRELVVQLQDGRRSKGRNDRQLKNRFSKRSLEASISRRITGTHALVDLDQRLFRRR